MWRRTRLVLCARGGVGGVLAGLLLRAVFVFDCPGAFLLRVYLFGGFSFETSFVALW